MYVIARLMIFNIVPIFDHGVDHVYVHKGLVIRQEDAGASALVALRYI